jgi:hypothetical protein
MATHLWEGAGQTGVLMPLTARRSAFAIALLALLSVSWNAPTRAQSPDEYADEWTEARRGDRTWMQRATEQLTMGPLDRLMGPSAEGAMKQIINRVIDRVGGLYERRLDPCLAAAVNQAHNQALTTGRQEIMRGAAEMLLDAGGGAAGGRNLAEFLGQTLYEKIKDKIKDRAIDEFKTQMRDRMKQGLPVYFADDDNRTPCHTELRIVWDKAAERYEFLIAGDCACNRVSCGKMINGSVPLRRWTITGSGTVIPNFEQLRNGDIRITYAVSMPNNVEITADCCGEGERRFRTEPRNAAGNEWVGFVRQPQTQAPRSTGRTQPGGSPSTAGATGSTPAPGGSKATPPSSSGPPRRNIEIPDVPEQTMTREELEQLGERVHAAQERAQAAHAEASRYLDELKDRQPPPSAAEVGDAEAAVEEAGKTAQRARSALDKIMEKFNLLDQQEEQQQQQQQQQPSIPADPRMRTILDEHNKARAEVGSPPLQWDPALAAGAASYAQQLTTLGRVHAPREGRKDIRENLLQSLNGQRSPKQMVSVWIDEKRYFKPGVFPNVSSTGNWADVGHYTQLIWPTTTRLGCAIHSDARYDWTVCRYSPPGNRDGTPILANDATSGIAPATSTTPATPPEPSQPPPPPKASDPAPGGNEAKHPLIGYFTEAYAWHRIFVDCGNTEEAEKEMARMRYALRELRKRLKTAKAAGSYSTVDVSKLEEGIKALERMIKTAEHRVPEDACPPSPPPRR